MIKFIKNLFDNGAKVDYRQLVKEGAIIIDVRTKGEYESGHIEGSINVPVGQLNANLNRLKDKNKPVITCCASGMRSTTAKSMLLAKGYAHIYNGGSWRSLLNKLS